jgi:hypothetical protein
MPLVLSFNFHYSNPCKLLAFHQHGSSELLLADLGIGDWFGGLLFSAGQQANEAVQDQLSALSFSRSGFFFTSVNFLLAVLPPQFFLFSAYCQYLFLSNF